MGFFKGITKSLTGGGGILSTNIGLGGISGGILGQTKRLLTKPKEELKRVERGVITGLAIASPGTIAKGLKSLVPKTTKGKIILTQALPTIAGIGAAFPKTTKTLLETALSPTSRFFSVKEAGESIKDIPKKIPDIPKPKPEDTDEKVKDILKKVGLAVAGTGAAIGGGLVAGKLLKKDKEKKDTQPKDAGIPKKDIFGSGVPQPSKPTITEPVSVPKEKPIKETKLPDINQNVNVKVNVRGTSKARISKRFINQQNLLK